MVLNDQASALEREQEIKRRFELLKEHPEWVIEELICMGNADEQLSQAESEEAVEISGCLAKTLIYLKLDERGRVMLKGSSNALVVQGVIALLKSLWDASPAEVVLAQAPGILKRLALFQLLSRRRGIGIERLIHQIQEEIWRLKRLSGK